MKSRTLVIPGGAGFLGRHVARHFVDAGWRVVVLSRDRTARIDQAEVAWWDGQTLGDWASHLDGADAVLNLAGRSVNCRYNASNRRIIEESRTHSTRVLGEAIARSASPPAVWLNSSTATIYRHAEDRPQDETTGEIGSGFSVDVATAWERAFFEAQTPGVRKVALRTAIVMGRGSGGPYQVLERLARWGLGGRMGSGRQYMSWVHVDDFCRAAEFLIDRADIDGPVNVSAPGPLPNADFMRALRQAVGRRIGLPAPRGLLEIGVFFLRSESELVLKSRWVMPARLQSAGFQFAYTDWPGAARALVAEASMQSR